MAPAERHRLARQRLSVGGRSLPVWPGGLSIEARGSPGIRACVFPDHADYHAELIGHLLAAEHDPQRARRYYQGACGTKLHDIGGWGLPAAHLIHARAQMLFMQVLDRERAWVDNCWSNLYRARDYCMPHSHVRTAASVVYMVDPGEEDADDPLGGRLCFVDPRLGGCCQEEDGAMTTPFVPDMTAGTMLIFPSQLVHCVNPYWGGRPRITLSWNIHDAPLSGAPQPDL